MPAEQRPSGNFLMDKLNLNNLKIDMTAKQALNKVKMTAESIKNKVQDFT